MKDDHTVDPKISFKQRALERKLAFSMTKKIFGQEEDQAFDIAFWQAQTSKQRFQASEDMVVHYLERMGQKDESRLQRSVTFIKRSWC